LVAIPAILYEAQGVASNRDVAAILRAMNAHTTTTSTSKYPMLHLKKFAPRDCARLDWNALKAAAKKKTIKDLGGNAHLQMYCVSLEPDQLFEALDVHNRTEAEYGQLRELLSQFKSQEPEDIMSIESEDNHTRSKRQAVHPDCSSLSKYRSIDGSCNNVNDPTLSGRASVPYVRILAADYDDGQSALRTLAPSGRSAGRQGRLPNPRVVSTVVHSSPSMRDSKPDDKHTLALMQWGQFLAHDVAMTPKVTVLGGSKLACGDCYAGLGDPFSPCAPIPVPRADSFFPYREPRTRRHKCMEFTRSRGITAQGVREQENIVTAYVDSSTVYGSDEAKSRELRQLEGGRLKVVDHPMAPLVFKPLLPTTRTNQDCVAPSGKCFFAGEERSSEQPALASVHTLFVREHNRLADQLTLENPHWSDETLYQEARKIVTAVNQRITYTEFLPRVLGPALMSRFGLEDSVSYEYDPACSAEISNEFAAAAFRFGHTLVKPELSMMDGGGRAEDSIHLRHHFFNPDLLVSQPQVVDRLMRGILTTPMEAYDAQLARGLTNHLFERRGDLFSGLDLAALNIQRGRDHGLRGYVDYLRWSLRTCGNVGFGDKNPGGEVRTFEDLANLIGLEAAHTLSRVYRSVQDIDLFTGGLSEPSLPGGIVGQTFGCIIATQFDRLKRCDRHWWQNDGQFTPAQRREIRKVTISGVICRNWDNPGQVQPRAFDLPSGDNPLGECMSEKSQLDIKMWRERSGRRVNSGRSLFDVGEGGRTSCDFNGWIISVGGEREVGACTRCRCHRDKTMCGRSVATCGEAIARHGLEAVAADRNCQSICTFNRSLLDLRS